MYSRFWLALSHYIKAQDCAALEPAVRDILSISKKVLFGSKKYALTMA